MSVIVPVVLSGGAGSRLWPLSTQARPKQYHRLIGEDTMLAETLSRVSEIEGNEVAAPWIICGEAHAGLARETLNRLGHAAGRVIAEPSGRNTAPAAALACLLAVETHADALVLMLPSDHHIGNVAAFRAAIARGAADAAGGRLIAFGVTPTRPETGYGYIQTGAGRAAGVFEIRRFVEKPPLEQAEHMLAAGDYAWNAGIFLFHAATFVRELERLNPDMLNATRKALAAGKVDGGLTMPEAGLWSAVPADSIDYAVMQETTLGSVVPADMDWSDLGSFQTMWEMSGKDEAGNALSGDVVQVGSSGSFVRNDGDRVIALVDCEDLVVVDTGSAVLVMPRARAQSVKTMVEALKAAGRKSDL